MSGNLLTLIISTSATLIGMLVTIFNVKNALGKKSYDEGKKDQELLSNLQAMSKSLDKLEKNSVSKMELELIIQKNKSIEEKICTLNSRVESIESECRINSMHNGGGH